MEKGSGDHTCKTSVIGGIKWKKVYIRTFGCTYNLADSQKLGQVLEHQQCTIVNDPDQADVVIVNTCTVIGSTERKVLREIRALCHLTLYVTGCMAVVQKDVILSVCNARFIHP